MVLIEKDCQRESVPYDNIVLAVGIKANKSLEAALYEAVDELYVIGDAEAPRKIWNAVHEGFRVAKNLL